MIELRDIRTLDVSWVLRALWRILEDRERDPSHTNISHQIMPTWEEHCEFVLSQPYRRWFVIALGEMAFENIVGSIYTTRQNEIGIHILSHQRHRGYAREALQTLTRTIKPLPAIPGQRVGRWIANINPANSASIALFEQAGFTSHQLTLIKEER